LSKRERYLLWAAVAVLGVLVVDKLVLTPIQERRTAIQRATEQAVAELDRARARFAQRRRLAPLWRSMTNGTLRLDPAEAESRLLHAARDWSQEAGLSLSSIRPERTVNREDMLEMTFQAAGTGPMRAVAGFLWRLETADFPVRVTELQLGTRKEGADDLSLHLRLSTLAQPPQSAAEALTHKPVGGGGDEL